MNTFENDLSLYDEATEGLKDVATKVGKTIGNAAKAVLDVIKAFGDWLLKQLHKLLEWGKTLKRNKLVNPEADEKAQKMSVEISDEISDLAQTMDSILTDIVKSRASVEFGLSKTDKQNAKANIFDNYSKMSEALQKSGEIANKLRQLPKMKMSYSTCGRVYINMKKISDNNSKMYKVADTINRESKYGGLHSDYIENGKSHYIEEDKLLTKFLNLYQKLRKCTEALLAKFNGMSSSDSDTSLEIKRVEKWNDMFTYARPEKIRSPIDDNGRQDIPTGVDADIVRKTVAVSRQDIGKKINNKLSDPKFTKLNNGNSINTYEWITYVTQKVEKDAADNPNDKKKQLIAERMKDRYQKLLYVLSVTNVANVKKWLNSSANESVSSDSDDLDFTNIIYENIRESVLEDAYLEAEEAADMAFEGLETEEEDMDHATESAWEEVPQLSVKKMIDSGMKKNDAIKAMDNFIKYMDTHKMMDKHYDEFTIDENTVVTKKDLDSKGIKFIKYCLKKIKEIPSNPENVEKLHNALQEYTKDKTKIVKVLGIISSIIGVGVGIIGPIVCFKCPTLIELIIVSGVPGMGAGYGFVAAKNAKKNIDKEYNM